MKLFFLANSKETVAWVFLYFAVFWKISWFAFSVLFNLCEEVDSLRLAAAQCNFSLVQVVSNTLRVSVFVSHVVLYLLLVLYKGRLPPLVAPVNS